MRYEDEQYVRVYVRDTAEWLALGWQAQALFLFLARKVDRAGLLELGRAGVRGLAAVVGMPLEVVEPALAVLLEDGRVVMSGTTLLLRDHIEQQEAPQSDAARKRESRARARDLAAANARSRPVESQNVTLGHETGPDVTEPRTPVTPGHDGPDSGHVRSPIAVLSSAKLISERAGVSGTTSADAESRPVSSQNVTEPESPPAQPPAPAHGLGAGTSAESHQAAAPPVPGPEVAPAELLEITDPEAALAKAELEARLRAAYAHGYERELRISAGKHLAETIREWTEHVHRLGRVAVVAECLDEAAAYWRRTAGEVGVLRFFIERLRRVKTPGREQQEAALG